MFGDDLIELINYRDQGLRNDAVTCFNRVPATTCLAGDAILEGIGNDLSWPMPALQVEKAGLLNGVLETGHRARIYGENLGRTVLALQRGFTGFANDKVIVEAGNASCPAIFDQDIAASRDC